MYMAFACFSVHCILLFLLTCEYTKLKYFSQLIVGLSLINHGLKLTDVAYKANQIRLWSQTKIWHQYTGQLLTNLDNYINLSFISGILHCL